MSTRKAIQLMLSEEAKVPPALLKQSRQIAAAIGLIVKAFRTGGRLFYVGAGTSGRLGVLDASECPPTFRTAPGMVQGIIAGGERALHRSIEGAEDDREAGVLALRKSALARKDVVVGIAASGTTPYVWGALEHARKRGCKTILVCFNPALDFAGRSRPTVVIAGNLGPEVLTGSTRLKAATATKLVLNMFTTISMVKLGKVISNLMVDVRPTNAKLRARAVRIVRELTGVDAEAANARLEANDWIIKKAAAEPTRKRRSRGFQTRPSGTRP
jgi:N-acetylmuramic acid 6-phosphate etherase